MTTSSFSKKSQKETRFSRFIREDSSQEQKKVFDRVLKKSVDDQKKIFKVS